MGVLTIVLYHSKAVIAARPHADHTEGELKTPLYSIRPGRYSIVIPAK